MPAPKMLAVYVVNGKRKPVATGVEVDASKLLPETMKHQGGTYYFSNADLVERTVTYTSIPLNWTGKEKSNA